MLIPCQTAQTTSILMKQIQGQNVRKRVRAKYPGQNVPSLQASEKLWYEKKGFYNWKPFKTKKLFEGGRLHAKYTCKIWCITFFPSTLHHS